MTILKDLPIPVDARNTIGPIVAAFQFGASGDWETAERVLQLEIQLLDMQSRAARAYEEKTAGSETIREQTDAGR